MDFAPNIDHFVLFALLIFPGMVAMQVYRLYFPGREIEWKDALVEASFFSVINFALFLPLIVWIGGKKFPEDYPVLFALFLSLVLLLGPIISTFLWVRIRKCKWFNKGLQLPHPTAWDYFFDKRQPCFVRLHLKEGGFVGGWFSSHSFASAFPRHGDIYIEHQYVMNKDGSFGSPVENSLGILIRSEDYTLIEFLSPTHPQH